MSLDSIKSIDELNSPLVHIANRARVNILLHAIITDGKDNVQVLSDFDGTITKSCDVYYSNSFALLNRCPSISPKYGESLKEFEINFARIHFNSEIGYVEKHLLVRDLWEKLMDSTKGEAVSSKEFTKAMIENKPSFREGAERLLGDLSKANVPVVVCTAGIGNTAEVILRHLDVLTSNIKVAGNFLSFDGGKIQRIKNGDTINTINKNNFFANNRENVDFLKYRSNFVVLGDMIGDANMADEIQHAKHVLKIGFSSSQYRNTVADFLGVFDIVIEDDSTVNVVQAIFNHILK